MASTENGYRACAQCGGTFPEEATVCPQCQTTGEMVRLSSDRVRALWKSSSAEEALEDEVRSIPSFGRYTDLELLGKGGMGRVYKAFDPVLNRTIALKFIRGDDPGLHRRLLMEARLQASLEHESICKVFEVGDVEGRLYIAMQYLRGETLCPATEKMNLLQKVRVMIRVSEAVHEAHRAGLIHRDLKPVNIMVTENDQGDWTPCVMDFGLARNQESPGLTASGMLVGSPHYMSPEQARGEITRLDRRSDVFSLGVTLYEVLSGKRPFDDNSNVEVLLKVLNQEPPPLRKRDPSLPEDLETIVMKCMEKDPEQRYSSARALAEDLKRYIDGDPITARPAGLIYRIRKKASKNKTITAVIVGSTILVLISSGIALRTQWQARQQVLLAHRFGIEVKEMESMLRNAHTMPIHNISRERAHVVERMKRIEAEIGKVGSAGYGPCHFALGRGYLALKDYDRARKHLELAWDSGYREPTVAYTLGQVIGILYDRQLDNVKHLGPQKESRLQEIQKTFRTPALEYLRMSRDSATDPPAYVEGLIAFYDNRYEPALRHAVRALQEVPWLYQAKKLEGDIYTLRGTEYRDEGKHDLAASDYQSADQAYAAAVDMARSEPALYVSECALWTLTMELEMARGTASDQPLRNAITACDKALMVQPEDVEALGIKAWAYWRWGEYQDLNGQDPRDTLSNSIQFGKRALQINPRFLEVWVRLGASYNTIGEYLMEHGSDPREMLQHAISSSREIIRIDPNHPYAYNILGYAAVTIAEYEIENGLDPRSSLDQATEGFTRTTQFDPKFAKGFNNLAYTHLTRGTYEMEHGVDARASFDHAARYFQEAIRVNSNYAGAFSNLGLARVRKAELEMAQGKDPSLLLEQALKESRHSVELNSQSPFGFNILGFVYLVSADRKQELHVDPAADIDHSIASLRSALELKADAENALVNIVRAFVLKGTVEMQHRRNPEGLIREARSTIERLKKINPRTGSVSEARVDLLEARWEILQRRSPLELLHHSTGALQNAKDVESFELLAEVFMEKARWETDHNIAASESIRRGIEAVDAALRINPTARKAQTLRRSFLAVVSPN